MEQLQQQIDAMSIDTTNNRSSGLNNQTQNDNNRHNLSNGGRLEAGNNNRKFSDALRLLDYTGESPEEHPFGVEEPQAGEKIIIKK